MTSQQDVLDTLAQVARAMGNGHRLALLERLAQMGAPVESLASKTNLTVGNASQHLQQLRRAGLVTASRSGKQMIYRLSDERIVTLMSLLRQVAETNLAEMERLVSQLFADDDAGGVMRAVSRDELLAGLERGEVVLLDVRPEEEYAAGHLPEALNIPLASLESMLDQLPRDREIVAYCRGPYCALSHQAEMWLRERGFQVRRFAEGFPEWKAAGLPLG
ncbi:ArsR/SmtB family transcription factor [Halomonas sp. G11]|uniref:ArsR/SmtB family transcription factor n=1 Tax=Halomonas sp. G11 TaxID=1684425 RepID=UPI0007FC7C71|nr:metalloregulator ArsR/SmtB family transcription factor [Halomonas sp. G11]OAZ89376.1 ArsR family transcriptional regulator [Halomonas sp. G11]